MRFIKDTKNTVVAGNEALSGLLCNNNFTTFLHFFDSSACSSLGALSCEENKALSVCIHHNKYELQPFCKQTAKYVAKCQDGQCGNFPIQEISEGSYNA